MNNFIAKIGHGVLYGIGFCLVFGVFRFIEYTLYQTQYEAPAEVSTKDIFITKQRKVIRSGKLIFLGTIQNTSKKTANGLTVNMDLFDNEQFTKQCHTYIKGRLKAGESRHFELSCGGCKKTPIVKHDKYKLYVTGY